MQLLSLVPRRALLVVASRLIQACPGQHWLLDCPPDWPQCCARADAACPHATEASTTAATTTCPHFLLHTRVSCGRAWHPAWSLPGAGGQCHSWVAMIERKSHARCAVPRRSTSRKRHTTPHHGGAAARSARSCCAARVEWASQAHAQLCATRGAAESARTYSCGATASRHPLATRRHISPHGPNAPTFVQADKQHAANPGPASLRSWGTSRGHCAKCLFSGLGSGRKLAFTRRQRMATWLQ